MIRKRNQCLSTQPCYQNYHCLLLCLPLSPLLDPWTRITGTINANASLLNLTEEATVGLEPLRWMKVTMNSMSNPNIGGLPNDQASMDPPQTKPLELHTYTDESAQKHALELSMDTLPAAILLMACAHIYVPLSLLTTIVRPYHTKSISWVLEGSVFLFLFFIFIHFIVRWGRPYAGLHIQAYSPYPRALCPEAPLGCSLHH